MTNSDSNVRTLRLLAVLRHRAVAHRVARLRLLGAPLDLSVFPVCSAYRTPQTGAALLAREARVR